MGIDTTETDGAAASVTRRGVLAAGLAGAGAVALAACSSSSGGTATKAAPSGGAGGGSAVAGGSTAAGGGSGAAGGSGGTTLATLADITVGQAVSVQLPGNKPGIVARPTADTAVCFSAICTHQGCTVAPAGTTLNCPCHGSRYNATTGAVLNGPAPSPLEKVPVTVTGGKVVVAT